MHGRGKSVIRGLRHVDVIVGMNRLLRSHHFSTVGAARNFNGPIGDDLVDVHVGLRAAARLPDAQRELVVQFAGDHLVGSFHN